MNFDLPTRTHTRRESILKSLKRATLVLLPLAAIFATGCSSSGESKKSVATVNGEPITEDEFHKRTENIVLLDLLPPYQQARALVKAGDLAMQSLISEKLILQFGKEKNVTPTNADINKTVPLAKKYQDSQFAVIGPNPARGDEEWRRDVRIYLIQRNLALAPLKITDEEKKKEYEVVKGMLTPADTYHLAVINVKTKEKAAKALDLLKTGVAFETVALTQSDDEISKKRQGDMDEIPSTSIPPDLMAVLKKLKPGEYAKQAVMVKRPSQTSGQPETNYVIPKFIEMKPGVPPTPEEAEPQVLQRLLMQKDPSALQRVQEDLMKFKERAKIVITLKPYEKLLDKRPAPATGPGEPAPTPANPAPSASGG
jgi:parvulin-like peptidyl-prolyl isomerase